MEGEYITQRDFAAMTGLSTSTVVNMIKGGRIKKNTLGHIPKSEVLKVYLLQIQKYVAYGTLVITFDKSKEELELFKQSFSKSSYVADYKNTLRYFTGVRDIIGLVTKPDATVSAEAVQERYNKVVLNLFMQRYTQMIYLYFSSLANEGRLKSFEALSVSDAFEYLMYEKFSKDNDEIKTFLKDSDAISEISSYIQTRFDSIMTDLCLVGSDKKPLFSRNMLHPDFFKCDGDLYNSFFLNADGKKGVVFLTQSPKVVNSIVKEANGKRTKTTIDTILTDGFVTILNVESDNVNLLQSGGVFVEGDILSEACCGAYSKIIITKSIEELQKSGGSLCTLPVLLEKTASSQVIFDASLQG